MGAIASVLTPILQIGSAIGTVAGIVQPFYEDNVSSKQLEQQNALKLKQAKQDAALKQQQITLETQQAEEKRRAALKRAMATQRANFGSQGVGSGGGSSEAVLLGMFEESDAERQNREQLNQLKSAALETGISQQRQLNLLQQEQLQERQILDRVSSFL
jgi:colicin import membrane protein